MRTERGWCGACGTRAKVRRGEADDGRPEYFCVSCGDTHTRGRDGEPWDTQPRPAGGKEGE